MLDELWLFSKKLWKLCPACAVRGNPAILGAVLVRVLYDSSSIVFLLYSVLPLFWDKLARWKRFVVYSEVAHGCICRIGRRPQWGKPCAALQGILTSQCRGLGPSMHRVPLALPVATGEGPGKRRLCKRNLCWFWGGDKSQSSTPALVRSAWGSDAYQSHSGRLSCSWPRPVVCLLRSGGVWYEKAVLCDNFLVASVGSFFGFKIKQVDLFC